MARVDVPLEHATCCSQSFFQTPAYLSGWLLLFGQDSSHSPASSVLLPLTEPLHLPFFRLKCFFSKRDSGSSCFCYVLLLGIAPVLHFFSSSGFSTLPPSTWFSSCMADRLLHCLPSLMTESGPLCLTSQILSWSINC